MQNGLFLRTRMCKFYQNGACQKGEDCQFAHAEEDRRPLPNFFRTKLCPIYMKSGGCPAALRCRFAHHADDVRTRVSDTKAGVHDGKRQAKLRQASDNQSSESDLELEMPWVFSTTEEPVGSELSSIFSRRTTAEPCEHALQGPNERTSAFGRQTTIDLHNLHFIQAQISAEGGSNRLKATPLKAVNLTTQTRKPTAVQVGHEAVSTAVPVKNTFVHFDDQAHEGAATGLRRTASTPGSLTETTSSAAAASA